jgi:peptidoglycan/LPS O-acetylase OafA/YrhL
MLRPTRACPSRWGTSPRSTESAGWRFSWCCSSISASGTDCRLPPFASTGCFAAVCSAGWIGVDLFFVLSGFLITGMMYDAKGNSHYFRNFYARRCLRIFPLYYIALIVLLGVVPRLVDLGQGFVPSRTSAAAYATYLSNVWIARHGWSTSGLVGHFWSLGVEEQFYVVWPVVVLMTNRRTLLRVCEISIVCALVVRIALRFWAYDDAAYVITPARMDALAIGAFLAVSVRGAEGAARLARVARPTALVTAAALIATAIWRRGFDHGDVVIATVGDSTLAVFCGAVLIAALLSPPGDLIQKILSSGPLRFFGRYSYALYVFHYPEAGRSFVRQSADDLRIAITWSTSLHRCRHSCGYGNGYPKLARLREALPEGKEGVFVWA